MKNLLLITLVCVGFAWGNDNNAVNYPKHWTAEDIKHFESYRKDNKFVSWNVCDSYKSEKQGVSQRACMIAKEIGELGNAINAGSGSLGQAVVGCGVVLSTTKDDLAQIYKLWLKYGEQEGPFMVPSQFTFLKTRCERLKKLTKK